MKKIMVIGCALTLSLLCTSAFATYNQIFTNAEPTALPDNNSLGPLKEFRASGNVTVVVYSTSAVYAAESKHKNGNRTFGIASNDNAIFFNDSIYAVGAELVKTHLTKSDSAAFDGWSSL